MEIFKAPSDENKQFVLLHYLLRKVLEWFKRIYLTSFGM